MALDVEFFDRYGPQGPPSLLVGCRGQCEATGVVPITKDETEEPWTSLWREAEAREPSDDGWHFVRCPDCGGSGRIHGWKRVGNFLHWIERKWDFAHHHLFVMPYRSKTAALVLVEHKAMAPTAWEVGSGVEIKRLGSCDRLDVPHPWLWNRRLVLRVLLGRVR